MVPNKRADLMQFGLNFPIRVIYAVMGFPEETRSSTASTRPGASRSSAANQIDPEKLPEARRQAGLALKGLYDAIKEAVVERRAEGAARATT